MGSQESKKNKVVKAPKTSGGEEWSDYLGRMNWNDANTKCKSLGMRLPTIVELRELTAKKESEISWIKRQTWSSTSFGDYYYFLNAGRPTLDDRTFIEPIMTFYVICHEQKESKKK